MAYVSHKRQESAPLKPSHVELSVWFFINVATPRDSRIRLESPDVERPPAPTSRCSRQTACDLSTESLPDGSCVTGPDHAAEALGTDVTRPTEGEVLARVSLLRISGVAQAVFNSLLMVPRVGFANAFLGTAVIKGVRKWVRDGGNEVALPLHTDVSQRIVSRSSSLTLLL